MKTQIERIVDWNVDAGNTADEINVRQSALYLGLQCEELAEKLQATGFLSGVQHILEHLANSLKKGDYDIEMQSALSDPEKRKEMLDADCDLIVVSAGAGMSQGADINAALWEVVKSNDSKRFGGKLLKDENGKIMKGPNFFKPDLGLFIKEQS